MTAITDGRRLAAPPASPRERILTVLALVLAAAAAAFSGISSQLHHASGATAKLLVVVPIAVVVAIGLAAVAFTRFAVFVMILLAIRASVDVSKVTSRAGGSTIPNAGSHAADPSSMIAVILIVASILWLAAQHYKGPLPGSRLRTALILLVIAGFVSVIGDHHSRVTSSVECLRVLSVVMMFAVLEQLMRDERNRRQLIAAVLASAVFPLAYTLLGYLTGHPNTELKGGFTRIIGTFHESNDYGRYLMLIIIFAAAIYPHVSRRLQWGLRLLMFFSAIFLVLTYTRTALIGCVLGLVIVGIYQSKRLLKGLALACVFSLLLVPSLASRFTSVASTSLTPNQQAAAHSGDSFSWRLSYWTEVLPLANQNPVTGIGLGETQYNTAQAKAPHNDYIRAYVETGVLGLFVYLFMLVALVQLGRKALKVTVRGTFDYGIAVGTLAAAWAYVVVSAAANVLSSVEILWYLFAFAAASSAIVYQNQAEASVISASGNQGS